MALYPRMLGDPDQLTSTRRAAAALRADHVSSRRDMVARARRSDGLARLPRRTRRRLLRAADAIGVTRGVTLGREGRLIDQVVLFASGSGVLLRDGREIGRLGPGDVFGLTEAATHRESPDTLITAEPSEILVLRPQEAAAVLDRRARALVSLLAPTG